MRQSLGTAVIFGMLGVTLFGLLFTPTFYAVVRQLSSDASSPKGRIDAPARSFE
jgi:HAE1 family hydrophobic/amphiphilic exporter-1